MRLEESKYIGKEEEAAGWVRDSGKTESGVLEAGRSKLAS